MSTLFWPLPFLLVGLALAAVPVPYQTGDEGLRSALNAVTRKQRSLGSLPQDYYNELRSFKYHGEPEIKYERDEIPEMEDDEDDLEFLPLVNGQLENIGGGYQGFNNKRLERALMDYIESAPIQRESTSSLFRERERTGNRKRNMASTNSDNNDLARLFLEELQNQPPYPEEQDDTEYVPLEALQSIYDRYRSDQTSKLESPRPMSWSELFAKDREDDELEYGDRERRPKNYLMYEVLPPQQRRNVNGRYPIGREYRDIVKRFPVAKRSAKPYQLKSQATDPKVAQDLGALFGSQSPDSNKTTPKMTHIHNDDHNHMHGMEHIHQTSERPSSTDIAPTMSRQQEGQKEKPTKSGKNKTGSIEVTKKSVDWSQYFGIDRRRKKAALLARPGTQEQDDEWMLQRYYKTMAENLKNKDDKNGGEKRDKLDQMDEKLKNVKNLIVEDAVRYSTAEDNADPQEVKDVLMARLAAAYSLEKMRRALDEFRNSIAAQRDMQRNAHPKNENSSKDGGSKINVGDNKRSSNVIEEEGLPFEGFDEGRLASCPEIEAIERSCKPAKNLVSGLFAPCVAHQLCKVCAEKDACTEIFAMEAAEVCDNLDEDSRDARGHCARTALVISQMQPSFEPSFCRSPTFDTCRHRYAYRTHRISPNPYGSRHHNSNSAYGTAMKR